MTPVPAQTYARAARALVCALGVSCCAAPAFADKISNPVAVFDGLDKITGRIISFEVAINETVQFGTLQITPRVCYSRPPTDAPQTDAFAQVDEITEQKAEKRIFSGWMFANSPGLHGVEHPIYDIWLIACKGGTTVIHDAPQTASSEAEQNTFPGDGVITDTGVQAGTQDADPQTAPPPKRRKPKPTVAVAPLPDGARMAAIARRSILAAPPSSITGAERPSFHISLSSVIGRSRIRLPVAL